MTAGEALRTGAVIGNAMETLRVSGIVELAQAAEAAGYDVVLVPESWGTESFSLVTAMGLATSRLRVGTAILPFANRSPGLVAQGAVTVSDAIGEGRFLLGLGMGHRAIAEGWHGIVGYRPRLEGLRDYVGRVRSALAGEPTAGGYALAYPPSPGVPLYLAALRAGGLRLAGEIADGALLYLLPQERIASAAAAIRDAAAAAGREPGACEVCLSLAVCVTDGAAETAAAREAARGTLAWYLGLPFYRDMLADLGFAAEAGAVDAAWTAARAAAAATGTAADPAPAIACVTDAMVDACFVVGDAASCRARIAAARAAGIDRAIVYPFGPYEGRDATLVGFGRTLAACAGA